MSPHISSAKYKLCLIPHWDLPAVPFVEIGVKGTQGVEYRVA